MINPIKHFQALYKAKLPVTRIKQRPYSEGYFMQPSPLSKVPNDKVTKTTSCVDKFISLFKDLYSAFVKSM